MSLFFFEQGYSLREGVKSSKILRGVAHKRWGGGLTDLEFIFFFFGGGCIVKKGWGQYMVGLLPWRRLCVIFWLCLPVSWEWRTVLKIHSEYSFLDSFSRSSTWPLQSIQTINQIRVQYCMIWKVEKSTIKYCLRHKNEYVSLI